MEKKKKVINLVIEQAILPGCFHPDTKQSIQMLKALYAGGVRVAEYSNQAENAVNNFLQIRKFADKELPGLLLGVGTIRNKIEATEFINEGADFIICPGVIPAVAKLAADNDLLWIPGCLTPTEVILADDLEAQIVEIFPASLVNPSYPATLKNIFPDLLFMSGGGAEASEENLHSWFKNGASAVRLDSSLTGKDLPEIMGEEDIASLANQTLQLIQQGKGRL